jgi:hypothetical protein
VFFLFFLKCFLFLFVCEAWSHFIVSLGLVIFLPPPPKCWDYRCVLPSLNLGIVAATVESIKQEDGGPGWGGKKVARAKRAEGMVQVVELLPGKWQALSSKTSTAKNKKIGLGISVVELLPSMRKALDSIPSTVNKERKKKEREEESTNKPR